MTPQHMAVDRRPRPTEHFFSQCYATVEGQRRTEGEVFIVGQYEFLPWLPKRWNGCSYCQHLLLENSTYDGRPQPKSDNRDKVLPVAGRYYEVVFAPAAGPARRGRRDPPVPPALWAGPSVVVDTNHAPGVVWGKQTDGRAWLARRLLHGENDSAARSGSLPPMPGNGIVFSGGDGHDCPHALGFRLHARP